MEHDEQAQKAEQQADELEQRSEQLGEQLESTRSDWDRKEHDASVPGAQPEPGEGDDSQGGP